LFCLYSKWKDPKSDQEPDLGFEAKKLADLDQETLLLTLSVSASRMCKLQ
jgi:hypothetical protein